MVNLSTKIKLYCEANGVSNVDFTKDVMLQDDMVDGVSNPYIKVWNLEIAEPSSEQLSSFENAANTAESNAQVIANRKKLYGSPQEQIQNIMEQGLEFEQNRVAEIKAANPKG